MPNTILILSGYNLRAVVAFCRWARARGLPFHLVARDGNDPILDSAYRDRVLLVRDSPKLDPATVCGWVAALRRDHGDGRVLLLPSTEFLNRFMLDHAAELERAGAIVPLVGAALYRRISDKYSFGQMCAAAGIAVPAEYTALPPHFPFVAKPLNYAGIGQRQLKPHLIHNNADLERFQAGENAADFYYQQFVDGRSLYLLAYLPKAGPALLYSQENLVQQARGGSVILARRSDFHRQPEASRYVAMLEAAGFHGLIMIEVRWQPASGQYFMIEANPRLWGPMQLLVDNDIDLFGALLREHGFTLPEESSGTGAEYYYWSGGLSEPEAPAFHHDYTAARLRADADLIAAHDLFRRADTMALYQHELPPTDPPSRP